jgi:hypothetical protein
MTPGLPPSEGVTQPEAESAAASGPAQRWYSKALAIIFATLCLEMGCFLLLFPWTGWASDFADFKPAWEPYWNHLSVRLVISALGLVNLYIAFVEIHRLRRFAKGRPINYPVDRQSVE